LILQTILDKYLQDCRDKVRVVTEDPKFRVSEAGRCHLMRYWKRMGVEPTNPIEVSSLRVFEVGTIIHRWIQEALRESGCLLAEEMVVEDEHRRGHIDAVVQWDGKTIIYDFKTVSPSRFSDAISPSRNYRYQLYTYYLMYPGQVDDLVLAYICKDDLLIAEVSLLQGDFQRELDDVKRDWEGLIEGWIQGREPFPNPDSPVECYGCIYRTKCDTYTPL